MPPEPSQAERDAARPVRPGARDIVRGQGAGQGQERDPVSGEFLPDMPQLITVERRIVRHDTKLDDLVTDFAEISKAAAIAEADWEEHRDRVILAISNDPDSKRMAADQRLAQAKLAVSARGIPGEDLYRAHLITKAAKESVSKHMTASLGQLSALQTLVRGLRQATGFNG